MLFFSHWVQAQDRFCGAQAKVKILPGSDLWGRTEGALETAPKIRRQEQREPGKQQREMGKT